MLNQRRGCRVCFWMMWNNELGWVCSRGDILLEIDPSNKPCRHFRLWNKSEVETKEIEQCTFV